MTATFRSTLIPKQLFWLGWCWALLLSVAAGCQQRLFYAHNLPSELSAPRYASAQKLDLSRLAQGNVRTEIVYPGDLVNVQLITGLEDKTTEATTLRVADDGTVNVPLVGPVAIVGLTFPDAERIIREASAQRGIYRNAQVTLQLTSRRNNSITVVGAVQEPGIIQLPVGGCDVLAAIVAAGGIGKDAGTIVEVRHPAGLMTITENAAPPGVPQTELASYRRQRQVQVPARSTRIDLEEASLRGNADLHLEDGSVVMVMKQPDRLVHVTGLVKKSDQFHLPVDQDIYLLDAISLAGGRTMEIADKVHIIRKIPDRQEPVVIEASVRAAKHDGRSNIRLSAGDVVSVEETPLTFTVGTIREFVRFGFSSAIPGF